VKKFVIIFLILACRFGYCQTCNALFSFSSYFEKVNFYNQSAVNNAHYYWNFGDGMTSCYKNPIHSFPGNGKFLVTLYTLDTISDCSSYYDFWVIVNKNYPDPCTPSIEDSFFVFNGTNYLKIINNSTNCDGYTKSYTSVGGNNMSQYFPLRNGNFLSYVKYHNSINVIGYGMKTSRFNFNSAKNYHPCSANFEFSVLSEDTVNNKQKIFFKAMNKSAASYFWRFAGMGDPIFAYTDTTTVLLDYQYSTTFLKNAPVFLKTIDQNGCVDSLSQDVARWPMNVTTVGLGYNTYDDFEFAVFPNPVKNQLSLNYNPNKTHIDRLSITNALGQDVYQTNTFTNEIDVSRFANGVYFLTVIAGDKRKSFKLIKN
jgi:hypothetical protein